MHSERAWRHASESRATGRSSARKGTDVRRTNYCVSGSEILRDGKVRLCGFALLLGGDLFTAGSRRPLVRFGCRPLRFEVARLCVGPYLLRLLAALLRPMLGSPAHHHDADQNQANCQKQDDDHDSHTANVTYARRPKRRSRAVNAG